jgi:hypothetical protein
METSGIEGQLNAVEKGLEGVGELLKLTPSKSDFAKLSQRVDEIEEMAKSADSGIGDLEEELGDNTLSELIKSAVTTAIKEAVKPLEDRIAELENSPVNKGIQDFDLAKMAGNKVPEPKEIDVMKGIIHTSYPELDGGQ